MREGSRGRTAWLRDARAAASGIASVAVWLGIAGSPGCSSGPPKPRPTEEWVNVLAPGMRMEEISEAIGVRSRWLSEAREGSEWATRSFTVTAAWKDERATAILIRFRTEDRPEASASSVREIDEGMSPTEVEDILGVPGLLRSRDSFIRADGGGLMVIERREWQVVEDDDPTNRHLWVLFENGYVTSWGLATG